MTRPAAKAWTLPSGGAFFDAVEDALDAGIACIAPDEVAPDGMASALKKHFDRDYPVVEPVTPCGDRRPGETVGSPFGARADIEALMNPGLDQHLIVVDLSGLPAEARTEWNTFIRLFRRARAQIDMGLSAIFLDAPGDGAIRWSDNLRRIDLMIWADTHVAPEMPPLRGTMAALLAVELCVWRLDLGASIVRANIDDLADPVAWLRRRESAPVVASRAIGGMSAPCPLVLMEKDPKALGERIWRAHLSSLFPWLEDRRQALIERYRGVLRVDDHLRYSFGVANVSEIEIGGLAHQLRTHMTRDELNDIMRLKRIRNALAHRTPASPEDVRAVLAQET